MLNPKEAEAIDEALCSIHQSLSDIEAEYTRLASLLKTLCPHDRACTTSIFDGIYFIECPTCSKSWSGPMQPGENSDDVVNRLTERPQLVVKNSKQVGAK